MGGFSPVARTLRGAHTSIPTTRTREQGSGSPSVEASAIEAEIAEYVNYQTDLPLTILLNGCTMWSSQSLVEQGGGAHPCRVPAHVASVTMRHRVPGGYGAA
jgi:hypothetical protein